MQHCGAPNVRSVVTLQREESSCDRCGSSLRCRGVIHALSTALFGRSVAIQDFPERPDIVGWGMTDWDGYASRLAEKLSYTNTFYHQEPHLDIMAISDTDNGQLDFLISSDVFEHVTPPVMTAFTNARRLLKPDGIFVLTVPYGLQPETIEHFPNLHEFTIVGKGDDRQLINVTVDGTRRRSQTSSSTGEQVALSRCASSPKRACWPTFGPQVSREWRFAQTPRSSTESSGGKTGHCRWWRNRRPTSYLTSSARSGSSSPSIVCTYDS